MKWLFGGPDEETSKMIIKGLKSENKSQLETIKSQAKAAKIVAERHDDELHTINRRNSKDLQEARDDAADAVRVAERDADDEIRQIKDDARDEIIKAEDAADKKVREALAKVENTDVAVKKARLEEQTKALESNTKLEVKVAVAEGNAKTEAARADAAESLVESIEGLLEDANDNHSDFTKLILAKIAEVKLDKFAINVEMPSPEVTVINSNGGNKGGEQKK